MDYVPYGRILRRGWLFIVAGLIIGAVAGLGVVKSITPTYSASTTFMLQIESDSASAFERNQLTLSRIKSYPAIVDSPQVLAGVRKDLGPVLDQYSDRDLRAAISAENPDQTVLLNVKAEDSDPQIAADLANAAGLRFAKLIEDTENMQSDGKYDYIVTQMMEASPPQSPSAPRKSVIIALGAIVGIVAGALCAAAWAMTRRTILDLNDVRRTVDLPVVGRLPKRGHKNNGPIYETSALNLQILAGVDQNLLALVPVSDRDLTAHAQTGLLGAIAATGQRVVCLDLHPSSVSAASSDTPTLETLVASRGSLELVGNQYESEGIAYVSSEGTLSSASLADALSKVSQRLTDAGYFVIIIVPEDHIAVLSAVAEAGGCAAIVASANQTTEGSLAETVSRIRLLSVSIVGVLLVSRLSLGDSPASTTWREGDLAQQRVEPRKVRNSASKPAQHHV